MRTVASRIVVDERQYSLTVPLSASTYNAYDAFVAAYGTPNARISLSISFDPNAAVSFTLGAFPHGVRTKYTGLTGTFTYQASGSNPDESAHSNPAWSGQTFASFDAFMNGVSANAEAAASISAADYLANQSWVVTYSGGTIGIGVYPYSATALSARATYQWVRTFPSSSVDYPGLLWV